MRNIRLSRGYREFLILPAPQGTSPIAEGLVGNNVPGSGSGNPPRFHLEFSFARTQVLENPQELLSFRDFHAKRTTPEPSRGSAGERYESLKSSGNQARALGAAGTPGRGLQALTKPMPRNFSTSHISLGTFPKDKFSSQSWWEWFEKPTEACAGETSYHSFSLKSSIYWHNTDIAWEANSFHIIYWQCSSKDAFWGRRKNFILQSLVIQPCWSCPHTNQRWHIFSTSGAKIIFKSIAGNCRCCHSKPLLFPLFYHHWCNPTSVNSKHGLLLQLLN